jgi:hypothetical protein
MDNIIYFCILYRLNILIPVVVLKEFKELHIYQMSLLLVEETRVPKESHRPVASDWQTLSHNVVSSMPWADRIRTHNVSSDNQWFDNDTFGF